MSVIENNKEPRWRLTWIDDAKKVKKKNLQKGHSTQPVAAYNADWPARAPSLLLRLDLDVYVCPLFFSPLFLLKALAGLVRAFSSGLDVIPTRALGVARPATPLSTQTNR